jgi:hypothetical protein
VIIEDGDKRHMHEYGHTGPAPSLDPSFEDGLLRVKKPAVPRFVKHKSPPPARPSIPWMVGLAFKA